MDLQSRFKRIVLALSVGLLGVGFGMTGYDAYRSVEYVSDVKRLSAAMIQSSECGRRVFEDEQAAIPVARRWVMAHGGEYQASAERAPKLRLNVVVMRVEPGVIDLMNIIRQRDVEFARASVGVQRLIVAALLPGYRSRAAEEKDRYLFPLAADQSDEHKQWMVLAGYAFGDEFGHCREVFNGTRYPQTPAGLLVYYGLPVRWRCCPGLNVTNYWVALLPLTAGLVLSIVLAAVPWGVFYVVQCITRTFGDTAGDDT